MLTLSDGAGTITRTYDALNCVTSYTNHNRRSIGYSHDEVGNLISLTYSGGEIIQYRYYKSGWLKSVFDQIGTITEYTYDGSGCQIEVRYANGTKKEREYDPADHLNGLWVTKTNGAGEEEPLYSYSYTYDFFGNITQMEGKKDTKMCGNKWESTITL